MSAQGTTTALSSSTGSGPTPPPRGKTIKIITWVLAIATVGAGLVLAFDVMLQPWMWNRYVEVPAPPREISQQEALLREKLNSYEKSSEDLKSLVSLLLGLSSLYALSLGVASYIGVQEAKDRADQTVDRLNKLEDKTGQRVQEYEHRLEKQTGEIEKRIDAEVLDIRRQFPLFRDMQESIQRIGNNLEQFVPDGDFGRDVFERIDVKRRVMIEHFERSVGAFEFFDLTPFSKEASRVYVMLGSYYSHKYAREATEHKTDPKTNPLPDPGDLERATWYLNRAHKVLPGGIAPLNELGYLYLVVMGKDEEAAPFLEQSLKLQDDQQRARHMMAIIEHTRGTKALAKGDTAKAILQFQESLRLLDHAIDKSTRWQATPEPPRYRRALLYNRACALARLAELKIDRDKNALRSVNDLDVVFPLNQSAEEQRVSDFQGDVTAKGDLYVLFTVSVVKTNFEKIVLRILPTAQLPTGLSVW